MPVRAYRRYGELRGGRARLSRGLACGRKDAAVPPMVLMVGSWVDSAALVVVQQ